MLILIQVSLLPMRTCLEALLTLVAADVLRLSTGLRDEQARKGLM